MLLLIFNGSDAVGPVDPPTGDSVWWSFSVYARAMAYDVDARPLRYEVTR